MLTRRGLAAGLAAAPWLIPAAGYAHAAPAAALKPHAVPDFYAPLETYDAALSPDGGSIAILRTQVVKLVRQAFVDVVDAADPTRVTRSIPIGEETVHFVEWASEDRLLITLSKPAPHPLVALLGPGFGALQTRMFRIISVDKEGKAPVVLFNDPKILKGVYDLSTIADFLPSDPDHILMVAWHLDRQVPAIWKVNVVTGAPTVVEFGKTRTVGWSFNKGAAVLRMDSNARGTVQTLLGRAPGREDWKFIRRTRTRQTPDFVYVGPAPSGHFASVLVAARQDGEEVVSLRELDLRTLTFGAPIARRDGLDCSGGLVDERGRYLGAAYVEDRLTYDFVDPGMGAHFKGVNRFFGDERSVSIFDVDEAQNRFVALVSGPRDPGQFVFYDKQAKRLSVLGSKLPKLEQDRLGKASALRVKTRDGATITAYLTAPPGEAPGPLVVYPHGGPEYRDHLAWDRWVQILAAQGWWVLQPNFRGSSGYGRSFVEAGNRRWGDRMQEDLEDAVAHVLSLGKADPRRVAILGSSYGGYAALIGAVRRPDLYRACVSVCGVTDLPVILAHERKEDAESFDYWRTKIGDPATDKAMLEAASPARRAGGISCPVLLIHGVQDSVVPVEQSRIMVRALQKVGREHRFIEVQGAGHADWDDATDEIIVGEVVAFIKKAFA